jgi:hypothetical protein
MSEIYEALERELMNSKCIDITRVAFLTGAVHALRMFNGLEVPEIELPFMIIKSKIGEEELGCLLKLFSVQENITQSMLSA